jgi:16S rRNA (cytosine967-C5)-methyltransferase
MEAPLVAVRVLSKVLEEGQSLATAIPVGLPQVRDADRRYAQEICYGVLRWHLRLEAVLAQLLRKPIRKNDRELHTLLLVCLYRLVYMRAPDYAVVNSAGQLVRQMGKGWASGLVNGVLRNFLRRRDELLQGADETVVGRHAHPSWLIDRVQQDWPEDWTQVLAAANERPPMSLRVNSGRVQRSEFIRRLTDAGLAARPDPLVDCAVRLGTPRPVTELPGFENGDVSVQDVGAQLAAPLLQAGPGHRVLDACAAPGGKTGHILESAPALAELVAVDLDADRLDRLRQNLVRLKLSARPLCGDASTPAQWWSGRSFDRILLDAPCSGTGVIRRHPDIKHLRREADLDTLTERQRSLLAALWPLLAPGGRLLYVTCSILKQENERQIAAFLAAQPDAEEEVIRAPWGRARPSGRQILTGEGDMDGFFYARLRKIRQGNP